MTFSTIDFIRESNRIEGITREPTDAEVEEFKRFLALPSVEFRDLIQFVHVYQPGAQLRDQPGMNVQVGQYIPPMGDITVRTCLLDILEFANANRGRSGAAYECHHMYESLHPFMDGNGRSGRMLWMWMMHHAPLGFLHTWYYQSLAHRKIKWH